MRHLLLTWDCPWHKNIQTSQLSVSLDGKMINFCGSIWAQCKSSLIESNTISTRQWQHVVISTAMNEWCDMRMKAQATCWNSSHVLGYCKVLLLNHPQTHTGGTWAQHIWHYMFLCISAYMHMLWEWKYTTLWLLCVEGMSVCIS